MKAARLDGAVPSMATCLPLSSNTSPCRKRTPWRILAGVRRGGLSAGGLKNAEDYLEDEEGTFVALNGDVLTGLDLAEVIEAHENSDALATITFTSVEDPSAYGLVEVDHRLGVKRFVEEPGSDEVHTSLINAGIYVLEREVLRILPKGQEVSIEREVYPSFWPWGSCGLTSRVHTGGTLGSPAASLQPPTTSSPARSDVAQSFGK